MLALAALHGAVEGEAGVSVGKVVQLAVHVVAVALEALEVTERSEVKDEITLNHSDEKMRKMRLVWIFVVTDETNLWVNVLKPKH